MWACKELGSLQQRMMRVGMEPSEAATEFLDDRPGFSSFAPMD